MLMLLQEQYYGTKQYGVGFEEETEIVVLAKKLEIVLDNLNIPIYSSILETFEFQELVEL